MTHEEIMCDRTCGCATPGATLCNSTSGRCWDQRKAHVPVSVSLSDGRVLSATLPQKANAATSCGWNDVACVAGAYSAGETVGGLVLAKAAAAASDTDALPERYENLHVLIVGADPLHQFHRGPAGSASDEFRKRIEPGGFGRSTGFFVASTVCWVCAFFFLIPIACMEDTERKRDLEQNRTCLTWLWAFLWIFDIAAWICFCAGLHHLNADPDNVAACFAEGPCDAT